MLLSKEIEVTISSCTKKHYEDLGYNIPKYFNKNKNAWVVKRGTKIIVKVEDTPLNSEYIVKVKCDYCGKEHKKSIKHLRIGRNKIINKDCCGSSDCQHKNNQKYAC